MKDNSFALAMGKIVGEAEAEQKMEARALRRSQILGRVRGVFIFLLAATIVVVSFCYRVQLQSKLFPKPAVRATAGDTAAGTATGTSANQTASGIKAAQDNAATRDKVISEIEK